MSTQLALGVRLRDEATFANFYPGENQELIYCLQDIASGQGEQFVYFWGPNGIGRSHLLQACCHTAYELGQSVTYLPLKTFTDLTPQVLEGLEALSLVCIDDIEAIVGQEEWEEGLFHLYNRMRDSDARLIVAANAHPKMLGLTLSDLTSRLSWGVIYQLQELSEPAKLSAIQMRAKERGLHLSDEVGEFLLRRFPRNMSTLFNILETLDHESLAAQRKLTIPFVKTVLPL